ncbi:hypothetical protein SBY92_002750 [Candida maltosa Xu316]
MSKKPQTT